ncbi:hypothetical protein HDV00_007942 [Rhizophlyctis rosea]|nr:hypothetical protein HDV00_007942 [Rhizophlyctis rosea]
MVSLDEVHASNVRIASTLPTRLVAVVFGGTSGIGEFTLKAFAKHVPEPRIYILGRSQQAADRIIAECKELNPKGEYIFMPVDASLLVNVDTVSKEIIAKEKFINLLVVSTGSMDFTARTSEGPLQSWTLAHHSRIRFIRNLLPLLRAATHLRRVVSIFTGTKEGPIDDPSDHDTGKLAMLKGRGYLASQHTFALEELQSRAPDVSFIHDFPGPVKTNIGRDMKGPIAVVMNVTFGILGPFLFIKPEESGERHLYACTSARYPAQSDASVSGVPVEGVGAKVARGTDGKEGSGVYSTDEVNESASRKTEEVLEGMRKSGIKGGCWEYLVEEGRRITGSVSVQV